MPKLGCELKGQAEWNIQLPSNSKKQLKKIICGNKKEPGPE
jgi:hypothetical protein